MKKIDLNNYSKEDTAVYIIDMNNGFAKEGNLYSPNVEALIGDMVEFLYEVRKRKIKVIAVNDRHEPNDEEFENHAPHCIDGTVECETVDEIQPLVDKEYSKNTTNALLSLDCETHFKNIKTVIIIGCVTDICIKQFAIALKKYFAEANLDVGVIVIEDLVTTYDIKGHEAITFHNDAISEMEANGVEILNFKKQQVFPKVYQK
jgi:nicotinamidase-related amidase